jgi:Mlc titration factor MtfA (ptsG expression regulator)
MLLSWLRRRRRERILSAPFPAHWQHIVSQRLPQARYLTAQERNRWYDELRIFVAQKNWEGCAGLVVTEEMKVTIAALACYMVIGLDGDPFAGVLSILVYPSAYLVPEERWHEGWSIQTQSGRWGESWYRGPVILAWDEVDRDLEHPGTGHNLVWHEFAHQIDMLDRSTNGTPPLDDPRQRVRWHDVMTEEFQRLRDDARSGRDTVLDTYGAENEAEFFAVVTECFFDRPVELRGEHPSLYQLLADYYRQDPAARRDRA